MDFSLSPEQQALKDSAARFVEREYGFEARNALLRGDRFSAQHWATFAELGWLGAGLSEEEGGFGGGPIETAIVAEELGRALALEPFAPCAVMGVRALLAQASEAQREALIEPIISGESICVLAHGERAGRGEDAHVAVKAAKSNDGYKLSGRKCFVLGGPHADAFVVSARTSGQTTDRRGVSLFLVAADAQGVDIVPYHGVDGRMVCDLVLDQAALSADALIGEEGGALDAVELALDHGLASLCAEAVGAMDAALWMTRDYLQTRSQFGVTLNTFQALQHRMADMLVETELARSMLYRALAALETDDPLKRRMDVAAAKAQIGEAGHFVGAWAVQLHGAIGTTEEHPVGHLYKRLAFVRNFMGASDVHLARFAAWSAEAKAQDAHGQAARAGRKADDRRRTSPVSD